jgi:hypothetical protein
MEYMGLGEMWDYVLDKYIFPLVSGVYLGYNDVSDLDFNSEISFLTNFLLSVSSLSVQVCGAVQSGPTGVFKTTPRHSYLHHQFGPEQC